MEATGKHSPSPSRLGWVLTLRDAPVWRGLALCAALVPPAACGHPCRDLSDTICRCAQTTEEEQRCIRQVHALASQDKRVHDANATRTCAALLETCTCEALAAGDLAACGLATQGR